MTNVYEEKMIMKKIIVVDDDETIRKTFFLILNKEYRVYLAKDSKEALRCLKKVKIDLVIADLKLPDTDGLEMISKLRDCGYTGEVILISAHPDLIELDALSRLSIGHFFVKPLDLDALNHSIEFLLCPKQEKEKRA